MKKGMIGTTAVLLSIALGCGLSASAEITDASAYMGDWYVNYLMEGGDGLRINVAGGLQESFTLTFNEDGTGVSIVAPLEDAETEEGQEMETESMEFTWELTDGIILITMEDESTMSLDEVDGEVIGDIGEDTFLVLGREMIQEEVDWAALMEDMEGEDEEELANTPKENPYVYDPEAGNTADVIGAYMKSYSYGLYEYEIALDEAASTFTAKPETDYSEAEHIEGTYEITEDNFVNIKWTDTEYDFENSYLGAEYVDRWNKFTVKEDLSNLKDVIAEMAAFLDYEHSYTADAVTLNETSETEGTVVVKDGDYEFTYDYAIVPGVDPILKLSYYDEELDYSPEYSNYDQR